MKQLQKYVLILLFALLFYGCKKDNNNNNAVPNTLVDIYIYTNNPSFVNISVVGGWTYVTGGVRGILIYRKSQNEFMTFDRNCTYDASQACATVHVESNNILAKDTCCQSTYSIYDGSVTQGPAGLPLKMYNNTFDGNVLHIYN